MISWGLWLAFVAGHVAISLWQRRRAEQFAGRTILESTSDTERATERERQWRAVIALLRLLAMWLLASWLVAVATPAASAFDLVLGMGLPVFLITMWTGNLLTACLWGDRTRF